MDIYHIDPQRQDSKKHNEFSGDIKNGVFFLCLMFALWQIRNYGIEPWLHEGIFYKELS